MGSAGLQLKRHQAVSIGFLDQVVMSDGRFAPVKIHNPFNDRAPFAGKRRAYGAGLRNDMSPDNGKVFPADFFFLVIVERMFPLTRCFATTVRPEVSRSSRLQHRKMKGFPCCW